MFELLGCPVAVEPAHMQAVVATESSGNPFAIGVVGHRLSRQPRNQAEALALVQELRERGLNYSVGLAQVNKVNFAAYGLSDNNLFGIRFVEVKGSTDHTIIYRHNFCRNK